MMEEKEKAMKQLIAHVDSVCKEYGITVVINMCVEEQSEEDVITHSASQLVRGNNGSLKRLLASALNNSNDFKELMVNSFMLSEKLSESKPTIIKLNLN